MCRFVVAGPAYSTSRTASARTTADGLACNCHRERGRPARRRKRPNRSRTCPLAWSSIGICVWFIVGGLDRTAAIADDVLRGGGRAGHGRPRHIHFIIRAGVEIGKRPGGRDGRCWPPRRGPARCPLKPWPAAVQELPDTKLLSMPARPASLSSRISGLFQPLPSWITFWPLPTTIVSPPFPPVTVSLPSPP